MKEIYLSECNKHISYKYLVNFNILPNLFSKSSEKQTAFIKEVPGRNLVGFTWGESDR